MTTFRAVNWTPNEMIGEVKMDASADNAEWLFRNTPRAIYTLPGGLRRVEGVKIASGRIVIPKSKRDTASAEVRFGNFFSTRCQPNITTGLITGGQYRIFDTLNGIGTLIPDHRGFQVTVNVDSQDKKKDKILRTMYVGWVAMGY